MRVGGGGGGGVGRYASPGAWVGAQDRAEVARVNAAAAAAARAATSCRWAVGLFLRTGSYERDFHVREGRTTVIFVTVNVFVDLTLCCS